MKEKVGWLIGGIVGVLLVLVGILFAFGVFRKTIDSIDYLLSTGKIETFLIYIVMYLSIALAILLYIAEKGVYIAFASAAIAVSCFFDVFLLLIVHADKMSIWLFLGMPFILYISVLLYRAINKK